MDLIYLHNILLCLNFSRFNHTSDWWWSRGLKISEANYASTASL